MTVCFFSAQYAPTVGGVERYTEALAHTLVQRGERVIVVTSALPGLPAVEDADGIRIYRMPSRLFLKGRLPVVRGGKATAALWQALAQENIGRIVVNTRFYPLSLAGVRFAAKHHISCIVLEHGSAHLTLNNPVADFAIHVYEHAMMSLVRRYCPRFYGVSNASVRFLTHFGVLAEGTLNNAIDPAAAETCAAKTDWRTNLGLAANDILVVFSGRLVPEKGVLPLARAMEIAVQKEPRLHLAIAGDGMLREKLTALAAPHTTLTGMLPYAEVLALLRAGDIFCLPTVSEGFATALLEAAVFRCYLIATNVGGAQELIPDAAHGTILSACTPTAIADAILAAAQDPARREAATALCRTNLTQNYTWDVVCTKLQSIPL